MSEIKVGIAEDQEIFRKALSHLLDSFSGVKVIAEAENGKILLDSQEIKEIDIAILDYKMPIMGGIETSLQIKKNIRI